jgi:cytochrome oxidase Cu insertion factor (SCO1/SenC/PrrC family)
VGRAPGKDGEIDHLVVSFLVDPEGRVVRRYVGLRHGPDEIVADLERMASG